MCLHMSGHEEIVLSDMREIAICVVAVIGGGGGGVESAEEMNHLFL
jgi:NADH dehydrogenase FAD-containing subunit